ncbi:pyrroloquinoline quinone biosynthesis protein PqqE [Steroidobacter sp.]|uniref:pyrroloquinoline quinone biosynthesis protein PqqE n=1 Tax=Steroidobacter sp. TaxID=1978227 RepID=UPI001A43A6EB|nr:pyrroloquinoline quinone biosynthesis protein PqqE [Steroidobacter sp.]MBL8270052.1 pyrroloquinoline quinone biosynthesis protein PqqE [Steroidobacter sp.]
MNPAPPLSPGPSTAVGPPLWLLFELTYRCPLQCVFCYNPVDFAAVDNELTTAEWLRVLREARALGSVQLGLSGGEPLMRDDVEEIAAEARQLGYYSNLITSGVGLTRERLAELKRAGLDHIQLSFQDSTRELNDFLSHTRTFELKQRCAEWIKSSGYPMVLNCVIHRLNIDHLDTIIDMAVRMGADYLELANTQYYSWAHLNREHLLPSRAQLERAERITNQWRARLQGKMRIFYVVPDFYEQRPKRCANGWGTTLAVVTPDGTALPCHTAKMLPGIDFPNVRRQSMREVWFESAAFNRFRGQGWMKEPCASCEERDKDLGGCRCQAYLLAQDAAAADPVCAKSPHHLVVLAAVDRAQQTRPPEAPLIFRKREVSRSLIDSQRLSANENLAPSQ